MHKSEVFISFGELVSTNGDEFVSLEAVGDFRTHECCFGNVKRKKGLDAVSHVIWRIASGLASGDAICPENMVSKRWPLCDITVAGLHEGVTDGAMRTFDDSVCL